MSNWSRRVRQTILGLVVLVAVAHANLTTDLTGRAPNASGVTRLGRDLLRRGEISGYPDFIYSFFTNHPADKTAVLRRAALV